MKRAAIISAVLDEPRTCQREFNNLVSEYNEIIRGRMGIPFGDREVALIALTVVAEQDVINEFTGKLGRIDKVAVKAMFAREGMNLE